MASFQFSGFQATVSPATVGILGGDEVIVTVAPGSAWPVGVGLFVDAGGDANGNIVNCISGRAGQQNLFYPLGDTLTFYTPQQFLPSDLAFQISMPANSPYGNTEKLTFFIGIIPRVPDMYAGCTFDLRSLLPVNYAVGARSMAGLADQGGY